MNMIFNVIKQKNPTTFNKKPTTFNKKVYYNLQKFYYIQIVKKCVRKNLLSTPHPKVKLYSPN